MHRVGQGTWMAEDCKTLCANQKSPNPTTFSPSAAARPTPLGSTTMFVSLPVHGKQEKSTEIAMAASDGFRGC
ncbi:hypothetical protein AFLA_013747 [Aspergillus flavus NRRL3357]|nr:hypothetical protein AFLA_013747 [Aspergillus flavus NRRL3357]